jgi:hypothetical protein
VGLPLVGGFESKRLVPNHRTEALSCLSHIIPRIHYTLCISVTGSLGWVSEGVLLTHVRNMAWVCWKGVRWRCGGYSKEGELSGRSVFQRSRKCLRVWV